MQSSFFPSPLVSITKHGVEVKITTEAQRKYIDSEAGMALMDRILDAHKAGKETDTLMLDLHLAMQARTKEDYVEPVFSGLRRPHS